jgi:hypothetical protein
MVPGKIKEHQTASNRTAEGDGVGAYIKFKDGETVQAKVASSYISPGAG